MTQLASLPAWDIFCNVIDNLGDIGVCWRLSRQLTVEHGCKIRLWVNELVTFQRICPEVDPQRSIQRVSGVEIHRWDDAFPDIVPGKVVIEAFGCRLPERFIIAMARCRVPPTWINLEYLSAEAWVSGCHALPSPHPSLPLTKYFFFPGYGEGTGGVLREHDLQVRRQAFCASPELQNDLWLSLGRPPPHAEALLVSLFAYENAAIGDLLSVWAHGKKPVCCLAPVTRTLAALETFAGQAVRAGDVIRRGRLEVRVLPFIAQQDYDRLLWASDINFVRGEDSFVRAQWAAKPMVWHIYPQDEHAHLSKLGAFLDLYTDGAARPTVEAVRELHGAWNSELNGEMRAPRITPELWQQWMEVLPDLRRLAENWANHLINQEDLCSSLVRFCRSKL